MRQLVSQLLTICLRPLRAPVRLVTSASQLLCFNLLFLVCHFLYSGFSILLRLWNARHYALARRRSLPEQLSYLRAQTAKLKKKPQHVALVLEDNALAVDLQDYVKLILWCIAAEIHHITLFDPRGTLKAKEGQLVRAAEERRRQYSAVGLVPPQPLVLASGSAPSASSFFSLSLLSASDGKAKLVDLTRAYARTASPSSATQSPQPPLQPRRELTQADVDGMLCGPEADLMLQLGGSAVGCGFLPWQMRVTEIYFSPSSAKTVAAEELVEVMRSYAGCVQRFGT